MQLLISPSTFPSAGSNGASCPQSLTAILNLTAPGYLGGALEIVTGVSAVFSFPVLPTSRSSILSVERSRRDGSCAELTWNYSPENATLSRSLMTIYAISPLQFGDIATYPLASRRSKVTVADFAKPPAPNSSAKKFLDSLPNFLAASDLRDLLAAIHAAKRTGKATLWGMGGHVIKTGLGLVFNDLIRRGFVSGIAMNGAALIHDFEIALCGNTSEDVEAGLGAGKFGMARETGIFLNKIASTAAYTG